MTPQIEEKLQSHERRAYNQSLRQKCFIVFVIASIPLYIFAKIGGVILAAIIVYAVYRRKKKARKVTFYRY